MPTKRDIEVNRAKQKNPYPFTFLVAGGNLLLKNAGFETVKLSEKERVAAWDKVRAVCGASSGRDIAKILGMAPANLNHQIRTKGPGWITLITMFAMFGVNPWWVLGASPYKYLVPANTPFNGDQKKELQEIIKAAARQELEFFNTFSQQYNVPVTMNRIIQRFVICTGVQNAMTYATFFALCRMRPEELDTMLSEIFIIDGCTASIKGE